ncbi:MAG TPA: acyl-CoA dehydrogenase, partial [Acidimicrobiales bacterium]|nr:acyl-CoA dehydrogenase [Acidimicrobiales bacterium]
MSTTDEARVTEAVEQLLAETHPKQVDKVTVRGAVYDAGLAWIHFPEGWGGMGLAPTHQRIVEKALR